MTGDATSGWAGARLRNATFFPLGSWNSVLYRKRFKQKDELCGKRNQGGGGAAVEREKSDLVGESSACILGAGDTVGGQNRSKACTGTRREGLDLSWQGWGGGTSARTWGPIRLRGRGSRDSRMTPGALPYVMRLNLFSLSVC